jgi:hypothetical protein
MGFGEETPCHVFDFWSQVYEGLYEDIIDLGEIQPHTHRLLMIRPDEVHPSLLSTSIHFTQGAVEIGTLEWNSKAKTLEFTIIMDTRKDESIYVVFNGRWKPRSTFIDEMQVEFTRVTPEVIKVSHKFRRGQSVRIQFDSI